MKQNNPFDEEGTEVDAPVRVSEEFEEFTVDSNSFIEKDKSLGISPVIIEEEDTEDASDKYKMSEDTLLVEEKTLEVFQQAESTLLWRIEGMYKSNGDLHSRSFLRKNPPIFVMESSTGDIAQFIVTEKLSYSLREAFDQIYRGYFGVSKNRKKIDPKTGVPSKVTIQDYIKANPLKVGFIVAAIVLALVILVVL